MYPVVPITSCTVKSRCHSFEKIMLKRHVFFKNRTELQVHDLCAARFVTLGEAATLKTQLDNTRQLDVSRGLDSTSNKWKLTTNFKLRPSLPCQINHIHEASHRGGMDMICIRYTFSYMWKTCSVYDDRAMSRCWQNAVTTTDCFYVKLGLRMQGSAVNPSSSSSFFLFKWMNIFIFILSFIF